MLETGSKRKTQTCKHQCRKQGVTESYSRVKINGGNSQYQKDTDMYTPIYETVSKRKAQMC